MINNGFDGISEVLKVALFAGICYYVGGPVGLAVFALLMLLKKR